MRWEKFWETWLEITPRSVELIVSDQGRIVLQAQFYDRPVHSRALPRLLEALALWQGERICAVIFAESVVHPSLGLGDDGDEWPAENSLVEYAYMYVDPRPLYIRRDSGRDC